MHKRNMIHRDIKLENVWVDEQDKELTCKLNGMGYSRVLDSIDDTINEWCGTLNYMAPEIVNGLPYDSKVDIWSFGVVCYAALVGKFPFEGQKRCEIIEAIK